MKLSESLFAVATDLASQDNDASQRRAISSAYYSVFHMFAEVITEALLGKSVVEEPDLFSEEWIRVYRSIDHITLKKGLQRLRISSIGIDISATFASLQDLRHLADYDPSFDAKQANLANSAIEDAKWLIRDIQSEVRGPIALSLALEVLIKSNPNRK